MRAAVRDVYGEADVVRVEEVPVPVPAAGEVLVRVTAASIGQDVWHVMAGMPLLSRPAFGLPRPRDRVLGGDAAGVVAALGPGVTGLAVGERVLGRVRGAFAEFAIGRADLLVPIPAGHADAEAAALPVSGITALDAIDAARLHPGSRVLVLGAAGGVGHLAVQLAVAAGAEVEGVARSSAAGMVAALGAVRVHDYAVGDPDGAWDAVIDTGGRRPLRVLRRMLAPGGRAALVGGEGGGPLLGGFQRQLAAGLLRGDGRTAVGIVSTSTPAALGRLADLAAAGDVRARVAAELPLERAADGIRMLRAGGVAGKVVLRIGDGG